MTAAALARPAVTLTSSSPAKKRDEKKSRGKGRRPKFQDNPPAPEIVEKKELKSEMSNKDEDAVEEVCDKDQVPVASANGHGVQADEESEEEEVDDDEPAQLEMVNKDQAICCFSINNNFVLKHNYLLKHRLKEHKI